jgi:phage terminase small subunit
MSDELNYKQQLFVEYYIQSLNATESYQKAYDCDYDTARVNGSRLLTNADIRSQVNKAIRKKMADEEDEFRSIWEKEVKDLTVARISDYLNEDGDIDIEKTKEIRPGAIAELQIRVEYLKGREKDGSDDKVIHHKTLKLHPKTKALELAGKYLALITDRVDHTTNGKDLPSELLVKVDADSLSKLAFKMITEKKSIDD